MAKSGGPTVGLDVGSDRIKAVELIPGRQGPTIRALGIAPTPVGAMENNIVVDAQLLGAAIKKLLKESGIGTNHSVSSVSGQSALVVRVIEVPAMSDSELAETMKWEVERHVPFAANEVIMDFQPITRADTPPDAQNMEVLLAVAQQDMIDRHVDMLFAAGLKPTAIDVEPLACCRSLIELGPDPYGQKTTAVINIGASNTDVGIFKDGVLAFPRTLPLAGSTFTRAISTAMGVDEEQAEELKAKHAMVIMGQAIAPAPPPADAFLDFNPEPSAEAAGPAAQPMPFDFSEPEGGDTGPLIETAPQPATPPDFDLGEAPAPIPAASLPATTENIDPTTMQVFGAIAPVLSELVTELRRSIEYYRGRAADAQIDEILLCGGSARIKNLDQFLSSELGIPARVANPLQFCAVAAKNMSDDYLEEIAPSLAVAIGLAARDMVATPDIARPKKAKRAKKS